MNMGLARDDHFQVMPSINVIGNDVSDMGVTGLSIE
jgi:hypothetical protein